MLFCYFQLQPHLLNSIDVHLLVVFLVLLHVVFRRFPHQAWLFAGGLAGLLAFFEFGGGEHGFQPM